MPLTVYELLQYLLDHISEFDEDSEVWFMSGVNMSSPCTDVIRLNKNDIVLDTFLGYYQE